MRKVAGGPTDPRERLAEGIVDDAENYLPILVFVGVGLLVGVVFLVLGFALGPQRPDTEKLSPYECGFEAFEDARMKFDVPSPPPSPPAA